MTRLWGSCLFLLTFVVALVASTDPDKNKVKVVRELKVIDASNYNVKQCLWFAMQEYNKESEDKYIFHVVKIVQVQLQVTDRLEYFIDVEIARSNCRKLSNSNENCVTPGKLQTGKETDVQLYSWSTPLERRVHCDEDAV